MYIPKLQNFISDCTFRNTNLYSKVYNLKYKFHNTTYIPKHRIYNINLYSKL